MHNENSNSCWWLSDETEEWNTIPKPMLEIGEKPILWHIMKLYSFYGFNDFVILLGYKGYVIKEYFSNYFLHQSDVTNTSKNKMRCTIITANVDSYLLILDWIQRPGWCILRAKNHVNNEPFMLTYGDGQLQMLKLVSFHRLHGHLATVTSVSEGRYGLISAHDSGKIEHFVEKPAGDGSWINAGFFVCEPGIFDYLKDGDATIFEKEPLENLSRDEKIFAYKHGILEMHGYAT